MIDNFPIENVEYPSTLDEITNLIKQAREQDKALYPLGGQTLLDVGLTPERPGMGVSLTQYNQIIDFPARDMTVTVQAGVSMKDLNEHVANENLRLPIEVPKAENATLGGSIAVNVNGPRRYGFGTLRDYVIGISFVNDEGQEVKAGGRVVKNVAGYDLCKLQVGALGTLGIITQVTLKLRPLAEESALITIGCTSSELPALLDQLHTSRTRPVCIDVLNQSAAKTLTQIGEPALPESEWIVIVGFEDNEEAVNWQVQELIKETTSQHHPGMDARVNASSQPLWSALAEMLLCPTSTLSFKANLLPGAVGQFCQRIQREPEEIHVQAHAGNGIVLGHVLDAISVERAVELLTGLQQEVTSASGNLIVLKSPLEWKAKLPIWGLPRGDTWLMRRIKKTLDPKRLFNPGRFLDGI